MHFPTGAIQKKQSFHPELPLAYDWPSYLTIDLQFNYMILD